MTIMSFMDYLTDTQDIRVVGRAGEWHRDMSGYGLKKNRLLQALIIDTVEADPSGYIIIHTA